MTKRVLLPLDTTEHSELAIRALPSLCDTGDEIILMSIGSAPEATQAGIRPGMVIHGGIANRATPDFPVYSETSDQLTQSQLDELVTYLTSKASELRALGFSDIHLVTEISEEPAKAIVDVARRLQPSFIVMARTTRPSIGERVFGTVAQNVIREDVAPVMILPGKK